MSADPPIQQIFTKMGVEYDTPSFGSKEIRYTCPFHKKTDRSAQKRNASIRLDTGQWRCLHPKCGAYGKNITLFICKILDCKWAEAIEWLEGNYEYNPKDTVFEKDNSVEIVRETCKLPTTYRPIPWQHPYINANNYNFEVLQSLRVGVDVERGKYHRGYVHANQLILPYYFDGQCVGWIYKILDGKYLFKKGFRSSYYLYGYDLARDNPKKVYVCEGQRDVWRMRQYGFNAVALGGSSPSHAQVNLLLANWNKVVLCLDNDSAGLTATTKLYNQLKDLIDLEGIILPSKNDPEETPKSLFLKTEINEYIEWVKKRQEQLKKEEENETNSSLHDS